MGPLTAAPPLVVLAGPTATGKTELAIMLAEAVRADGRPVAVISADSRQVFRGLDIGTAKVDAGDRARVPHFGLDLADPDTPFSVADFAAHARGVLADLTRDGGVAILAGGTGLYLWPSGAASTPTPCRVTRPSVPASKPTSSPMACWPR
jgi:tRNA dimethylallyltransferase